MRGHPFLETEAQVDERERDDSEEEEESDDGIILTRIPSNQLIINFFVCLRFHCFR